MVGEETGVDKGELEGDAVDEQGWNGGEEVEDDDGRLAVDVEDE